MRDLLCRALLTYNFDYIDEPLKSDDALNPLMNFIKDLGSGGYHLMRVVGISVGFIALLVGAIIFAWTKNAKMLSENMKRLARIVIGMCGVFSILGIVMILLSIAEQIRSY